MNIRWRNLQTGLLLQHDCSVSLPSFGVTGHGQCYRALGRGVSGDATSLYANWTVVVSFFFIWRVFGFQAVDCGLRHWDSFLRFFTGAPQRNRSKGCLNCRSGTPSYPHTALDPATGGMWSWRWICEVNLKRCLDLESLFSQLYVIIDCRQLIIMIVHHMYIIVYSIYSIIW